MLEPRGIYVWTLLEKEGTQGVGEGTGHRCQGDGSEVRGTVLGGRHGQTTSSRLLGFRAIIKSGKPGSGI